MFVEKLDIGGSGPRVAIKDTIDVAGVPTRCGSPALAGMSPAASHAVVVERLLGAGCKIVGKTTLHELAFGVTGINSWAGTPVNNAWPDRIPGGSSSGSAAAIAAGQADIALGTDTGGSVRVPAACCGVIGLKPSFGRLDRTGVAPAESTLDCVGPFAQQMSDILFAMAAMDFDFVPEGQKTWRVGRLDVPAEPLIDQALDSVLATGGMSVDRVAPPDLREAFDAALAIINRETFTAFGRLLETGKVGEDVAVRLAAAGSTTDEQVRGAEKIRTRFRGQIDALFDRFDVLVLPTLPVFPPLLADAMADRSAVSLTSLVRPFNLSGHPALSLPVPTLRGLPAGLQIVGRHGEDALLCAVGVHVEQAVKAFRIEGKIAHA
ncbi:MAG: amidase [Novosphingobium sp.]